jgi:D-alanyl-D-alanine carboxypeptidase
MTLCKITKIAAFKLAILSLFTVFMVNEAQANSKHAAFMVDAKTGVVLHNDNADEPRFPASITKVMTLYMLFEQLEAGKFKLSSPLSVSAEAAAQPPTKIGLRAGGTITVEEAIRALVTKSANDAAVTIAENISGGDEEDFAAMMTKKARSIGMKNTTFRNASGLPDPAQRTTARDLVTLGRAIQDRFPKYYKYFSTYSFAYRGVSHRNHNKLLGRFHGVDGIKTGYTRASGFNLLSSVKRGERSIVAVVLGGTSGGSRDAKMRSIIESNMHRATTGERTTPLLADKGEPIKAFTTASVTAKPKTVSQPAQSTPMAEAVSFMSRKPEDVAVIKSMQMNRPSKPKSEWSIQIGAFPVEAAAKEALTLAALASGKALEDAQSYTENVAKGNSVLVRARFAMKDKPAAEAACKALKRSDFACITVLND